MRGAAPLFLAASVWFVASSGFAAGPTPAQPPSKGKAVTDAPPFTGPAGATQGGSSAGVDDVVRQITEAMECPNVFKREAEWVRIAASLAIADMPAIMDRLGGQRTSRSPVTLFLGRWVMEKPEEALDWVVTRAPGDRRSSLAWSLFSAWADENRKAAEEALAKVTDQAVRAAGAKAIGAFVSEGDFDKALTESRGSGAGPLRAEDIIRAAPLNPAAAARRLADVPPSLERVRAFREVGHQYAAQDPAGALGWLRTVRVPGEKSAALEAVMGNLPPDFLEKNPGVLSSPGLGIPGLPSDMSRLGFPLMQWAESDPRAAASWLAGQTESPSRSELIAMVASRWAKTDPEAAISFATQAVPAGDARDGVLIGIAYAWGKAAPAAALNWAVALPESALQHKSIMRIMEAWAQADPPRAAEYLKQFPKGELRFEVTKVVADSWIRIDPQKAVALIGALPESEERARALCDAASAWANVDLDAAAKFIHTLPHSERKLGTIWSMASSLTRRDPQMAIRWASEFSHPEERKSAVANVLDSWSKNDPGAAAAYAATLPGGAVRDASVARVVGNWVCSDPPRAAGWAAQLPESEGRQQSFRMIAERWAHLDEGALGRWLDTLPDSPSRDSAVSTYVAELEGEDPEAAFRWCESIQAPEERNVRMWSVGMRWLQTDRRKAEEAIRASGLPEMQREMLLRSSSQPQ